MKKKEIHSFSLDKQVIDALEKSAISESRSMSSQLNYLLRQALIGGRNA